MHNYLGKGEVFWQKAATIIYQEKRILALGQVRNGAEITAWVSEITRGRINLAPGTLYALLAQFLENDLITRIEVDKKGKYYIITDEGQELLEEEVKRLRLLIDNYENHFDKWFWQI